MGRGLELFWKVTSVFGQITGGTIKSVLTFPIGRSAAEESVHPTSLVITIET